MLKKFIAYLLLVAFSFSFTEGIFANYSNNKYNSNYIQNNSNVIIYKNGVKINGIYYTKAEFEKLLEKAEKISDNNGGIQTRTFPAVAGVYFIPGVGQVTILASGVILIGGSVIYAGSWLYNKVVEFFSSSKSLEQEYNDARRECRPSKDNNKNTDTEGNGFNKLTGWSSYLTLSIFKHGRLAKIRFFDKEGKAEFDIHFEHGGKETHIFPHCHTWKYFPDGRKEKSKPFPCCSK